MSSVKTILNSDYFGLYYNINGKEQIVSESTCIQPGDTVGVRYDRLEGTIGFDLNGIDYGIAFQHSRLDPAAPLYYPTVDIGMGGDSIELVDLPDWATAPIRTQIYDTSLSASCLSPLTQLSNLLQSTKGQEQHALSLDLLQILLLKPNLASSSLCQVVKEHGLVHSNCLMFLEGKY
jgi:hypothetical protein